MDAGAPAEPTTPGGGLRHGGAAYALRLLFVVAAGCGACDEDPPVAEVDGVEGSVDRDRAASVGAWEPAAVGDTLAMGDGIRTGGDATAQLTLRAGGTLQVEPDSVLRFRPTPPEREGPHVALESGEAILEAGSAPVHFTTSEGEAVVEGGGRVRIRRDDGGMRYRVLVGRAQLERNGGALDLQEGEGFVVTIGDGVVERLPADAGTASEEPAQLEARSSEAAEPPPPERGIEAEARGRGIRYDPPGGRPQVARGTLTLEEGTVVEVPRGASLQLTRGGERISLMGPGSYVLGGPAGPMVEVSSGSVDAEASETDLAVKVPGGTILLRGTVGSTRARVRARRGSTRVSDVRGTVLARTEDGDESIRPGEILVLGRSGDLELQGRGPERADVRTPAGVSFQVRAPSLPVAVGFDFSEKCPGRGVVQIDGRRGPRVAGTGTANVALGGGRHAYRIRCLGTEGDDEVIEEGRVVVARDGATRPLPRTPPRTVVDLDGRRYTVLYQNLLPAIDVRWNDAPDTGPYTLVVASSGSGDQRIETAAPRHGFDAGDLSEGVHRFHFEAAGRRSPTTRVAIAFDNASPAVYLRSPADRSFRPGDTVHVAGMALPGWKVTVGGEEMAADRFGRFSGRVTVPAEAAALAVRLSHPSRGVVYYLRRAEGTP